MEHGEKAVAFSSGMAATAAAISHATKSGSHIICQKSCYMPVHSLIESVFVAKYNMSVDYVDTTNLEEIEAAVKPNTDLIMIESPSTFIYDIVDIRGVAAIARKYGIKTYIDNTYSTPLHQKPLDMGIDYVMHTMTKYIGGHSDSIGGVLVVKEKEIGGELQKVYRSLQGTVLGPFEAWLFLRGIRTLNARLEAHEKTAMQIAEFLEEQPQVKRVYYPGLKSHRGYELGKTQMSGTNGLMSIEINGSVEDAVKFVDALKVFGKGCSWGGFESLAILPLQGVPQQTIDMFKCTEGIIRLHCGLEGAEVLIDDLKQALKVLD